MNNDTGFRNNSDHYGFVEIYREEKWWKLIDANWSKADANIVCLSLGYSRASENYTRKLENINATALHIDFSCNGKEGELADCFQREQKSKIGYQAKAVGVHCTADGKQSCVNLNIHSCIN